MRLRAELRAAPALTHPLVTLRRLGRVARREHRGTRPARGEAVKEPRAETEALAVREVPAAPEQARVREPRVALQAKTVGRRATSTGRGKSARTWGQRLEPPWISERKTAHWF